MHDAEGQGNLYIWSIIQSVKPFSCTVLIDGQAIYSLAPTALKKLKKALSLELSAFNDGKLPSCWNNNNLDKFFSGWNVAKVYELEMRKMLKKLPMKQWLQKKSNKNALNLGFFPEKQ